MGVSEAFVGSSFVLGHDCGVCRAAGVGEMVGAAHERAGHDDSGLDTPTDEFASVYDRHCVHACLREAK